MLMRLLLLLWAMAFTPVRAEWIVVDNLGEQTLPAKPTRIAVLNWDLAENLLELGITPVGMPNINDYHTWVVEPAVPANVVDLGTRSEPNLARLASLKPDLILAASPQRDLLPRLRQIAPVAYYETYQAERNAALAAIDNFALIGAAVGKPELAQQKLDRLQARFSELRQQLAQHYPADTRVAPIRFANTASIYLYGSNSTSVYALEQLGLTNAMPVNAGPWGIVQKRLLELQHVSDGYVLYFRPFPNEHKLAEARLWQAMPFVRAGHVNAVEPVWNYGGAMSIQRIGEGMALSLLEVAPR